MGSTDLPRSVSTFPDIQTLFKHGPARSIGPGVASGPKLAACGRLRSKDANCASL